MMTTEEFSNEFDILLNSYSLSQGIASVELNEYEKSVFLTNAQEELVKSIYSGKNPFGDSFEKTEEARRYLSSLIKTYTTSDREVGYTGVSKSSVFFKLPEDLWFITYEAIKLIADGGCNDGSYMSVVPVTQDEYHRIRKNPFRGPNDRRALRLDLGNEVIEIVSKYNIEMYIVRYISRPVPIILTNLADGLSINDVSIRTECELNPIIHRVILEKAVNFAILSRSQNVRKE